MNKTPLRVVGYGDINFASQKQLVISELIDVTRLVETSQRIHERLLEKYSHNILIQSVFDEYFYTDHESHFDLLCYLDAFYYYDLHENYSERYELEFAYEFHIYRDYIASEYRDELICEEQNISKHKCRQQAKNSKHYVKSLASSLKFLKQCIQIKDIISPSLIICHSSRHVEICQELIKNFPNENSVYPIYNLGIEYPASRLGASSFIALILFVCQIPFKFAYVISLLHLHLRRLRDDPLLSALKKYKSNEFSKKKLYIKCFKISLFMLLAEEIRKNGHIKNAYFIGSLEIINKFLSLELKKNKRTFLLRYNDTAFSLEFESSRYQFDQVLSNDEQSKRVLSSFYEHIDVSAVANLALDKSLTWRNEKATLGYDTITVLIVDESLPSDECEKEMRLRFLVDLENLSKRFSGKLNVVLRLHPTTQKTQTQRVFEVSDKSLEKDLQTSQLVIGRNSTLLLRASRLGYDVVLFDPAKGKFYTQNKAFYGKKIAWVSNFESLIELVSKKLNVS